jgi:hypothetical protein
LIQLVDVLAIALNRFRQLSFKLPNPGAKDYSPERRRAELDRLRVGFGQIREAVFSRRHLAPQHMANALANEAIAELVRQGNSGDEAVVRTATGWLAQMGWLNRPQDCPRDEDSASHKQFDVEGELLGQHRDIRENLLAALARVGRTVPEEIVIRDHLASISLMHAGEEPISQECLLEMVQAAQPQPENRPNSPAADAPKSSPPRQSCKKADSPNTARDKWIYQQRMKTGRQQIRDRIIVARLEELAAKRGWEHITSIQGIRKAADAYADANGLPRPPKRREIY